MVKNFLLELTNFPPHIEGLRFSYQACIKLANETDSKKEDKELRQDAAKLLESLQNDCPHVHVLQTQRHYPSYNSYEDPTPEERICYFCGTWERANFEKLLNPLANLDISDPLTLLITDIHELIEEMGRPFHY